MVALAVIGNVSIDHTSYPDGRTHTLLGGAALHVSLAAARARLPAGPISVIGHGLAHIRHDPRLSVLDLTGMTVVDGPSCTFRLTYDHHGNLSGVDSKYGVAEQLTSHALNQIGTAHAYHVCCRQPLDTARVLCALVEADAVFSVDFYTSSAVAMIPAAAPCLPAARLVFTNTAEYDTLAATVELARLSAVAVTGGAGPARLLRHGQQVAQATPPEVTPVELTGAGDTFTGTFLAAATAGGTDDTALHAAVQAASSRVATLDLPLPAGKELPPCST